MFVIALMAIVLGMGAMIAMFINAQKSVAMPWIVEVNTTTGVVNKAVKIEAISPSQAVIKAELGRWSTKVFTLDKYLTPKYIREAHVMTKGLATNQFTEFRVAHKVYERIGKEVPVHRSVEITSVDTSSQPGMAFVF
jgi:type IV secretory pathway TrbF-like protein